MCLNLICVRASRKQVLLASFEQISEHSVRGLVGCGTRRGSIRGFFARLRKFVTTLLRVWSFAMSLASILLQLSSPEVQKSLKCVRDHMTLPKSDVSPSSAPNIHQSQASTTDIPRSPAGLSRTFPETEIVLGGRRVCCLGGGPRRRRSKAPATNPAPRHDRRWKPHQKPL